MGKGVEDKKAGVEHDEPHEDVDWCGGQAIVLDVAGVGDGCAENVGRGSKERNADEEEQGEPVVTPVPEPPDEQEGDAAVDENRGDIEWDGQMQDQPIEGIMPPVGIVGEQVKGHVDEAHEQSGE